MLFVVACALGVRDESEYRPLPSPKSSSALVIPKLHETLYRKLMRSRLPCCLFLSRRRGVSAPDSGWPRRVLESGGGWEG